MAKKPLSLRIDPALFEAIDRARGDVSRTRFVERALEAYLGEARKPTKLSDRPMPVRQRDQGPGPLHAAVVERQGVGECPKATCSRTGPLGVTCPDHRNLRFKP